MIEMSEEKSSESLTAAIQRDAMTTNDTKAIIAELREVRLKLRENTAILRALVKHAERAEKRAKKAEFVWSPK